MMLSLIVLKLELENNSGNITSFSGTNKSHNISIKYRRYINDKCQNDPSKSVQITGV